MVTQADIDHVEAELQQLRTLLMTSRERVRPRLEALVDRTEQLQQDGEGSVYLPTINNVHKLLLSFQRGFEVNDKVRKMSPQR
jgi:peptidoglycan hydrolase CwlO-like protein